MAVAIDVKELSPVTLTRRRGAEAFGSLQARLGQQDRGVGIDLDSTEMLSASFLDELILRLAEHDLLKKVAFVTREPQTIRKLGIISHERKLTVFLRTSDTRLVSVAPLARSMATPHQDK